MRVEMNTAVSHKVFEASISIAEEMSIDEKINLKSSSKLDAKSPLGLKLSLEHTGKVGFGSNEISGENNFHGSLVTGPIKGDVNLTQSIAVFPFELEGKYESLIKVDSTPFQGQNKMEVAFSNGELSLVSKTAAFNDRLTNSAGITLMKSKLAMKSDTKASVLGMKIQNGAEANIELGNMNIKIQTTSSRSEDHINSLVTATVDANGLVVSSDSSVKLAKHTATHQASLTLNKFGIATSGSTLVNSFVTLNNTFNGIIHSSKGSLLVNTEGNIGGVTIVNGNSISASMSTVTLLSKSYVSIAKDVFYVYDMSAQAKPYSAIIEITTRFGLETELKQSCDIKVEDLTGTIKCSTNGKLRGAQIIQDTEMEIVGLNIRYKNDARFNSQSVRLSNTLQATASPFNFNLHALTNGDGELYLFGKHSGQIFTKLLLKAEPLALVHSHECRLSVTHELTNSVMFETNFDNKVDTLLTPSEQLGTVTMKTKINNNVINQQLNAYNNQERIGLEVSGLLGKSDNEPDFSASAYLKYDKTTEIHIINLQSLEALPAILENIKMASVNLAEEVRDYIKREEFAVKIQTLLQQISDFITNLNIEEQVVELKKYIMTLPQNCPISLKDLEVAAKNLKTMAQKIGKRASKIQEMILNNDISKTIIDKIIELENECNIRGRLLALIKAVEDIINQIDMDQLRNNEIFEGFDRLDDIKLNLQSYVRELKKFVQYYDAATFASEIKDMVGDVGNFIIKFYIEIFNNITNIIMDMMTELNIAGKCDDLYRNVKALAEQYGLDKMVHGLLERFVDLIKQVKINKMTQALVNHLKSVEIPFKHLLDDFINYTKNTEIKQILEDINKIIEDIIKSVNSFEYNKFADKANQKLRQCKTQLNNLAVSLELPQKAKATREFLNYAFSSISSFLQKLRATKVTELIKSMKDLIDSLVLNDIKTFAETLKQELEDINLREEFVELRELMNEVFDFVIEIFVDIVEVVFENDDLTEQIKELVSSVKGAELDVPSFTVPLTDLVLPSMKFSLQQLLEAELTTEFKLPEFTILGSYTVPEMEFNCDDLKYILRDLINFLLHFKVEAWIKNSYIEDLTLNFLPDLSAIALPEITVPHIAFPVLPKLNDKFMLEIPLYIPKIKLPKISSEIAVPTFGKLYSEIKFNSPFYTLTTIAEIRNSTDNQQKNHLIAFISSDGKSPSCTFLNYHLDATTRIGIPRMSRVVIAETIKFIHSGLNVQHQASVTLYGLSAQAIAQTTVKATTTPYNADIFNKAFIAIEGGMTASFDTTYNHQVNVPLLSLTSDASLSHVTSISQKGATFSLTVKNVASEKYTVFKFNHEITHNSNLTITMDPGTVKLTFNGDTGCNAPLNIKNSLSAEAAAFKHIGFDGRIETTSPFIKNSLIVAIGKADLQKMKLDIGATHDSELTGLVSGKLSNDLNIRARPIEISVSFQNKANTKVNFRKSFNAKIDLQNDYAAILNSKKQHINTAALVSLNQHQYRYNITIDNNNADAGIYASLNGMTNLEFLNGPISIPGISISVFNIHTEAINDVNLYEYSGLKELMTTRQTFDLNAKTVYQKSKLAPIVNFGLIRVPSPGKLSSEVSFKTSPINFIANAEIDGDNDLVDLNASVGSDSTGYLGYELHGKTPSQVASRLYRRHAVSNPFRNILL